MSTLYFAEMDTGNFCFTAIGKTRLEAKKAILDAWVRHRKQFPVDTQKLMTGETGAELFAEFDVSVTLMQVGVGYRDHDSIN